MGILSISIPNANIAGHKVQNRNTDTLGEHQGNDKHILTTELSARMRKTRCLPQQNASCYTHGDRNVDYADIVK